MNRTLTLSDKILIVLFLFSTILIVLTKVLIGGSYLILIIFSYFVYAVSFVVSYLISDKFSKRLKRLTFKVEEMAAGNLKDNLEPLAKDEIGQLTNSINTLKERLLHGVVQDISTHRELVQAKTDFVALASHQLRTPLSIIKWYVDFLLGGDAGEINEEQRHYLEEVYQSNERLIELVNNLLDVSRIDVGTFSIEPEPTDIAERANTAIEKFKAEIANKKINFISDFDDLPIINLDPRLIKIVFQNILSNAIKYTQEKGTILFSIKKVKGKVLIKVVDSGCGIPREEQPKVFTKLFRAVNAKQIESIGTGLGLYITKAVIEKSGGKIWFQSPSLDLLMLVADKTKKTPIDKKNLGTTFFITIPLKGMKKKIGTKKLTSAE